MGFLSRTNTERRLSDFRFRCSSHPETAADCLADDFTFHGPMLQASGKTEFLEGVQMAAAVAAGYEMINQVEQGNTVVSLYDFKTKAPATPGSFTITEWNTVLDGKVSSARVVFDTAARGELMPEMPHD